MPSTLGFALLGLLARTPSTGYDLARRMERPVGYFWTASHSQIYPELAALEREALIEHVVVEGPGPRPTKRYAVTPLGRSALAAWVATEMEPQPVRDLETLRLWSVWAAEPAGALSLVDQMEAGHVARLAAYAEELAAVTADPHSADPRHPQFASRLTLEGGVRARRTAVEWCRWLRTQLPAPAE